MHEVELIRSLRVMEAKLLKKIMQLVAVILMGLVLQSAADCPLSKAVIEATNRIFKSADPVGNLDLKRTEQVRTGEVLHMFCQANDIVRTTCLPNSTFSIPLPLRCNNPLAVSATIVADPSCPATTYSVGYVINNRQLEVYRSCYDRGAVKALFTTHLMYPKSIATERACPQLTTDGALSDADGNSFTPANVFNSFRRILGRNQRFIRNDRDTVILPARLTPSADFLFGDQICATSKYINVVPLFKSINDGNLQTIERWVRTTVGVGGHMRIRTGVLGTLSLRGTERRRRQHPIFLIAPNKNPVPEWIFKVVRTAANQPHTVFLTYNNIFGNRRPNAPNFCRSVPCPVPLANTAAAGYTFCCNAASFNR